MLKSVNDAAGSSEVKPRSRTSHDFHSNLFVFLNAFEITLKWS